MRIGAFFSPTAIKKISPGVAETVMDKDNPIHNELAPVTRQTIISSINIRRLRGPDPEIGGSVYKIKATVVKILGNAKKYPCHFNHKIDDEIIFDGEGVKGRICPLALEAIVPKLGVLRVAGPKYDSPDYYSPLYYAAPNISDPSMAVYDGAGFRTTGAKTYVEPRYHMRNLMPKEWGTWPPLKERLPRSATINVICPDVRTALIFKLEAFDLDDKGYNSLYFRRQMAILQRIIDNPGIKIEEIIDKFPDQFERETIYPPLHSVLIVVLAEGLEAIGYIKVKKGKATATTGGKRKFKDYKASLTAKERKALNL
jgi:uncharacterized repeat protein (TIGR04076 family)